MYKIRFHLAKGENFMKWQIKAPDLVRYVDPAEFQDSYVQHKLKGSDRDFKEDSQRCMQNCVCLGAMVMVPNHEEHDKIRPNVNDFYVRFNRT